MAYDDLKIDLGRKLVYYVEIFQDFCSNTFGVSPCQASGAAGTECFNTFPTCQDTANFDASNPNLDTTKTYRFSSQRIDGLQQAGDPPTFPTIIGVSMSPTVLKPGKGLGVRSTLNITLTDHPWTDIGTDPYVSTRNYDPDTQGSFWGKWLSRNKFYEGRTIKIYTGYLDSDGSYNAANFKSRTYLIHKISGPSVNGQVTIEAKDPLKKADNERSQWPPAPESSISADIDAVTTTVPVDDEAPIQDWVALGQRYIRIDDEIMYVVSVAPNSLTVQRATMPSFYEANTNEADDHSEDASIQLCYLFEEERIDRVIEYFLVDVSGIDSAFIPTAEWSTTILDSGYGSYSFSRLLVEPGGVKDYLDNLAMHNVYIWWDERDQEIKLQTLLPQATIANPFNEDEDIVEGSLDLSFDVKSRISQVWTFYGVRNPILELDETKNFQSVEVKADLDAESDFKYGEKRVMEVRSPWLTRAQRGIASEISSRLLVNNKDTKRVVSFSLDAKDDDNWTGNYVGIKTRQIQDEFGADQQLNGLVVQVKESLSGTARYDYVIQEQAVFTRVGVIAPNTDPGSSIEYDTAQLQFNGDDITFGEGGVFPDYSSANASLKARYAFISENSEPYFPDGGDAYQII